MYGSTGEVYSPPPPPRGRGNAKNLGIVLTTFYFYTSVANFHNWSVPYTRDIYILRLYPFWRLLCTTCGGVRPYTVIHRARDDTRRRARWIVRERHYARDVCTGRNFRYARIADNA